MASNYVSLKWRADGITDVIWRRTSNTGAHSGGSFTISAINGETATDIWNYVAAQMPVMTSAIRQVVRYGAFYCASLNNADLMGYRIRIDIVKDGGT